MSDTSGDSEPAAQRLALVARVFEPASEAFLAREGRRPSALAAIADGEDSAAPITWTLCAMALEA